MLTKQETLLGRGARQRAGGWGSLGGLLCHMAHSLGFYGDGISFQVVFGPSFWLRVLPGGAHVAQPRWMPARRILGSGWTRGVFFWPFLNSSQWWWLISSMFLISTSCQKNDSHKATTVPGQGVSPNRPRDRTLVSHIAGRVFTIWATREAPSKAHGLSTISPTSSQACTWVFTWLFHCSELHWRGLQEWGSLQLAAGGWPSPWLTHESLDSYIAEPAHVGTKPWSPPSRKWCLLTGNRPSLSRDQMEPSAQRPSHSSLVCPWCPAQKLSVPWFPGEWEIFGFCNVFLVPKPWRWKVSWMEANKPSLPSPLRRQRPEPCSLRGAHNSCGFSFSAWYLPRRMDLFRPHRAADTKQKSALSFLHAGDSAQNPQKFPLLPPLSTTTAEPSA